MGAGRLGIDPGLPHLQPAGLYSNRGENQWNGLGDGLPAVPTAGIVLEWPWGAAPVGLAVVPQGLGSGAATADLDLVHTMIQNVAGTRKPMPMPVAADGGLDADDDANANSQMLGGRSSVHGHPRGRDAKINPHRRTRGRKRSMPSSRNQAGRGIAIA